MIQKWMHSFRYLGVSVDFRIGAVPSSIDNKAVAQPLVQIHGDQIEQRTQQNARYNIEADGHWTKEVDLWLSVRSADCVPILVYNPEKNVIAAVHSGWKGTYAKITNNLYSEWAVKGLLSERMVWFVGPFIDASSFVAKEDVLSRFRERNFASQILFHHSNGEVSIDLLGCIKLDLEAAGFQPPKQCIQIGGCTSQNATLPSYRRDGEGASRIYSSICLNPL